ncbi:MAG: PfkB family carbohydrate kinase [Bacteroidia bacterium]|nr:PfkB family carbohydrate kinase [Bacteroidia bacterium]
MDFSALRFVVMGDVMLDRYLYGKVQRISPEAPVPILELEREENRLGGAANVALNLRSLGCQVSLVGVIGEDSAGSLLMEEAQKVGIDTYGILTDDTRPTTTKIRLIAQKHHLLRVDRESRTLMPPPLQEALRLKLQSLIQTQPHAIVLEDYDKGTLHETLIQFAITTAQKYNVPILVDPKKENFWHYKGATLFKPNLRELGEALQISLSEAPLEKIQEAIHKLRERMLHTYTVVTLSERGVVAYGEEEGFLHFPAHYRNIVDVSGAGDTVISVLAVSLAMQFPISKAVALANLAGGLVCEHVGVVPVPKEMWLDQARKLGLL